MKYLKYILVGIFFGIIMSKSEAISWFRIQEMFRFQSFHMYGIIGSALFFGVGLVQMIKKFKLTDINNRPIIFHDKSQSVPRYLIGGTIFGLGWALTGACPGPMFVLLGHGFTTILVIIFGAVLGTLAYGVLRSYLPH